MLHELQENFLARNFLRKAGRIVSKALNRIKTMTEAEFTRSPEVVHLISIARPSASCARPTNDN